MSGYGCDKLAVPCKELMVYGRCWLQTLSTPEQPWIEGRCCVGPIEAEVFENERYLPFRGWGHEWPGHLLPTDRVGHWSLRGDRPSGAESMEFSHVAPPLPEARAPSTGSCCRSFQGGILAVTALGVVYSCHCYYFYFKHPCH